MEQNLPVVTFSNYWHYLGFTILTLSTISASFKHKILDNVLFLNKKLYTFGLTNTAFCSFCNTLEKTPLHIFFDCIHVKCFWERLRTKLQDNFILPLLTQQIAILGLYNDVSDNCNLMSHILLIFKYYIYSSREKRILNIDILIANLIKVNKKEKQKSLVTSKKGEAYKKWCVTDNILPVT